MPNFLEAVDRNSGQFRIRFTPRPDCFNYRVDVTFNDLSVASNDCTVIVIDTLVGGSNDVILNVIGAQLSIV